MLRSETSRLALEADKPTFGRIEVGTMTSLRVALIGCGDHGRRGHLEAYRQAIAAGEDATVVAVCDRDGERARQAAELVPGARWYTDYREALEREQPEAVSIATPPAFHREQTVAALRQGAHVLCEKPLAMNLAEAQDMVAAADRSGRVLTMGLQSRFAPAARYLRDLLARGDLGHVYHSRVWAGHIWRLPPSPHFLHRSLAGGGVVAATTVHSLDAVLWMLGNPPVATVSAATFAKAPRLSQPPPPFNAGPEGALVLAADDVEDFAVAFVRFRDGSTLSIESSWLLHQTNRPNGTQFLAEYGVAENSPLAVRQDRDGTVVDRTPTNLPATSSGHYFLEVVRSFLQIARSGQPAVVTGPQMLQVQALIDGIYASASQQREISLPAVT
jgi:predicted dehydrogenase